MPETMARELARKTARRFLKSVVVIDNEACFGESPPGGTHPLDAGALTRAFAQEGILCSVLAPHDTDTAEHYVPMVLAADAAVLDWQMSIEGGDKTVLCRAIIKAVLEKEQGRRPRLILIYTGESVTGSLVEALQAGLAPAENDDGRTGNEPFVPLRNEEDGFGLAADKLHIVFVQKRGSAGRLGGLTPEAGGGAPRVAVEELPGCLLKEYTRLTEGILPDAAFNAVAAVRENTGTLLSLFKKELDPAFVHHLLLIPDLRDGELYLHELLRDGMYSVLAADGYCRENLTPERLGEWFEGTESFLKDKLRDNCSKFKDFCRSEGKDCVGDLSEGALFNYLLKEKSSEEPRRNLPRRHGEWFSILSGRKKEKAASDLSEICAFQEDRYLAEFARLHAVESDGSMPGHERTTDHALENGTVIFDGTRYLLCILPACDLVRLRKETPVPFLCLKDTESAGATEAGAKPMLCFFHGNNLKKMYFSQSGIWKEVTFLQFVPDADKGQILTKEGCFRRRAAPAPEPDVSASTCSSNEAPDNGPTAPTPETDDSPIPWVAKLKNTVMLDLHQRVFANMSRIGGNDFEWIRRNKR